MRSERGRFRINGIEVDLARVIGDHGRLDLCGEPFEDFCIVTARVPRSIPVHVSLKAQEDERVEWVSFSDPPAGS